MTLHFLLIVECQDSNSYPSTCSQEETHAMKLGSALMCEVGIRRSTTFKGKRVGRGKRQVLGAELLKTAKTMGHFKKKKKGHRLKFDLDPDCRSLGSINSRASLSDTLNKQS